MKPNYKVGDLVVFPDGTGNVYAIIDVRPEDMLEQPLTVETYISDYQCFDTRPDAVEPATPEQVSRHIGDLIEDQRLLFERQILSYRHAEQEAHRRIAERAKRVTE